MKICHLINSYPLPTGGMQSYCFDLADRQSKLGHDVHIYVSGAINSSIKHKKLKVKNFKPIFHFGKASLSVSLILSLIKERFDVLHVHLPFPFGFEMSLMVAKMKRVPIIATYHCVITNFEKNYFKGFVLKIYNRLNNKLLNSLDHLIFTTEDYLKSIDTFKTKVSTIPIGVDLKKFKKQNKESVRKKLGLPISKYIVLFVGNMDIHNYHKKGVEYLLKALPLIKDKLPNIYLNIIGKTDNNTREIVSKICSENNITDMVQMYDYVSNEDLPLYYAASDLLALPSVSRLEAFGIVLLEALASGIPIIASDIPGVRSVVKSTKAGFLVRPYSSSDLARKIVNISKLKNLTVFAINTAKNKYDWTKIVKEILDIYQNLINKK